MIKSRKRTLAIIGGCFRTQHKSRFCKRKWENFLRQREIGTYDSKIDFRFIDFGNTSWPLDILYAHNTSRSHYELYKASIIQHV